MIRCSNNATLARMGHGEARTLRAKLTGEMGGGRFKEDAQSTTMDRREKA